MMASPVRPLSTLHPNLPEAPLQRVEDITAGSTETDKHLAQVHRNDLVQEPGTDSSSFDSS